MRRFVTTVSVLLEAFTLCVSSVKTLSAQACQGVAGGWTDNYSFVWSLDLSGTSISGSVATTNCAGDGIYMVSGSINTSGQFTLNAVETISTGCAASSFTYRGSLSGSGCSTGSGTWSNDIGINSSWSWSRPCDRPDSESASNFLYWEDTIGGDPTVGVWRAQVQSNSGLVFGGRTVNESGPGSDGCYFQGSIYGPFTSVPDTSTVVAWDQTYGDNVGPSQTLTTYFRQQRPAQGLSMPCGWTYAQSMTMSCTTGSPLQFTTNQLVPSIGVTTVTSCRQTSTTQNCVTRTWP
jgi:hypothetical protein